MKKYFLLIPFFFAVKIGFTQVPLGSWRDHFSFRPSIVATSASDKVFVASVYGIFSYQPADGTVSKITRVNGLSDIGISTIAYSPFKNLLLVGYENGNIDMVYEQTVVNIPYIKENPMSGSKRINHFYFDGEDKAYISTGFGIVVLNLLKNEILDTYFIGPNGSELWVNQIVVNDESIYAATASGLFYAQHSDPLLIHFASWSVDTSIPNHDQEIGSLVVFNEKLVISQNQGNTLPDVVFYNDEFGWNVLTNNYLQVRNLWADNNVLLICSRQGIALFQSFQSQPVVYNEYSGYDGFTPNYAITDLEGNLVIADNSYGLMYGTSQQWIPVSPNSPGNSRAYYVLPTEKDLLVVGGSRNSAWDNMWYPLTIHTLSEEKWKTINNNIFFDAMRIVESPFAINEYYIATWGSGVVVYKDGIQTEWYNPDNSSLETIIPGAYCRIGGLTFDKKGNLWVANSGVTNSISLRLADGTWKGFPYLNQIGSQRLSDIVLTTWGHLWVVIPSGGGFFILDPGENPESISSHKTRKISLIESDGTSLSNDIFSIAFDRDGYLWIGTSEGVVVSYNPQKVLESSGFSVQRVKVPDIVQGLAVFLLESETVTSIAVDGANRKWFGTSRSGVFLQSSDGTRQIKHFTKENSPLPSNNIQHLAIHPKTGEVFIVTDMGMISYRGDATEPEDTFGNVYAFPNPVHPGYDGVITITGLVDRTIVKITDVAGNLVYETRSLGGQAIWDGKNKQGNRVATGVYLYFCADSQGEQSAVGKILFIK
jgi:hypothetical protein